MKNLSSLFFLIILTSFLISSCTNDDRKEIVLNIPAGFEIEDLYSPSESNHGSWVSLTEGPDQLFYACDQYGDIYKFTMPDIGATLDSLQVDSVDLNIGFAQGLLWAFNSLYVVVVHGENEDKPEEPTSGVYRIRDTDGNGTLDKIDTLLDLEADGEHGPHTLRIGPDGSSLYLIAGNFNEIPDHFTSRIPKTWQEDNLFPPYLDARGHAVELKAPGAWVAKTDPEGKDWEIIGVGMRNPFSFGFNADEEILAYDADMEWDFGMPWYRPTRILHITSGSEYGWRTGSGKWPVYYPDNLPEVAGMAQGSPTAIIMGKDLNFPTKYKHGLFACDWSFGTMYYVDIEPSGSSYKGTREEFLSGVPLPLSNAIAGRDGNLYFITGGRRLESHLYRLRYVGDESTEGDGKINNNKAKALREIRQSLEKYHQTKDPNSIPLAWKYLDHRDRFIKYAARIALEHQPLDLWAPLIWKELGEEKIIESAIAYARSGGAINQKIINKLSGIPWQTLTQKNKLGLLRSFALLLIRQDNNSPLLREKIINKFSKFYPTDDAAINRELCQLLLFVGSPDAVQKSIEILETEATRATDSHPEILSEQLLERSEQYGPDISNMIAHKPPTEAIHYVTMLSHAKIGWTKELRERYFDWFYKALAKKGGQSYKPFLDNIRAKALENVPQEEYAYFKELSGFYSPMQDMADLPQAVGPGKDYNLYDLGRIAFWGDDKLKEYEGSFADGARAYKAAFCYSCHQMNGDGGASGPDLTNLNTRFEKGDISNAILSPSEEISDQYAFSLFTLKKGGKMVGRVVKETEDSFTIYQSPYNVSATTELAKESIVDRSVSPISPMPAGLLNHLNEDEVKDLLVYLMAGGDPDHEYYE